MVTIPLPAENKSLEKGQWSGVINKYNMKDGAGNCSSIHIGKWLLQTYTQDEAPASTEMPLLLQLVFLSELIICNLRLLIFSKHCK